MQTLAAYFGGKARIINKNLGKNRIAVKGEYGGLLVLII